MGERKVLNKFYPPEFDPRKIVRRRRPKNGQITVRTMLPMTFRCNCCRNFIYRGTKFNSHKEDVIGESYLGIQEFRFYIKCSRCSAEITFKTDAKNSDYVVESGATRNFEPWRAEEEEEKFQELERIKVAEGTDAMKLLENKAADSKRELDVIAALDEVISLKSRQEKVGVDALLRVLQHQADEERKRKLYDEDDEALIRAVFRRGEERSGDQEGYGFVPRTEDDDDDSEEELKTKTKRRKPDQTAINTSAKSCDGKFIIKKKPLSESDGGNKASKRGETCLQSMELFSFNMGKYIAEEMSSLIKAHVKFEWREILEDFFCWTNVMRLLRGVSV